MNFALPALVLFILLLPGFVFKSGLKLVEREVVDFSPFGRVATEAITWAIIAHAFWLFLTWACFNRILDPQILVGLLSSVPQTQTTALAKLSAEFGWVAGYVSSLLITCRIIPVLIRSGISKWRLDRYDARLATLFRFHDAPWYYLLTGADFKANEIPDMIMISAVVEVGKESLLYVGVLDDFFFDASGQLDRIVLQQVVRRPLSSDKGMTLREADTKAEAGTETNVSDSESDRFYPIDGDYLVIRYSDAKTLNVQFIKLTASSPLE